MLNRLKFAAGLVLCAVAVGAALAATIPAGTQLHPTQTLVRNNGAEPETLDPALAESVGANNITRDLFEGLTCSMARLSSRTACPRPGLACSRAPILCSPTAGFCRSQ